MSNSLALVSGLVESLGSRPLSATEDESEQQARAKPRDMRAELIRTDPLIGRRNRALQTVYQFLQEEGLYASVQRLVAECGLPIEQPSLSDPPRFGVLLEALDIRDAYYQSLKSDGGLKTAAERTDDWLKKEVERRQSEASCSRELSTSLSCTIDSKTHPKLCSSNLLCVELSRPPDGPPLILVGTAARCVAIIDASDSCLNADAHASSVDPFSSSKLVIRDELSVSAPPLHLQCDPKYQRFLLVCLMNGSVMSVDLNKPTESAFELPRLHSKYVVKCDWSSDSRFVITGSHDGTVAILNRIGDSNILELVARITFDGCIEGLKFVPPLSPDNPGSLQFAAFIRGGYELMYFDVQSILDNQAGIAASSSSFDEDAKLENDDEDGDEVGSTGRKVIKVSSDCTVRRMNVNAFGDSHVSFSVTDLKFAGFDDSGATVLFCRTDCEKALLYSSDELVKSYFGGHSDIYSYSRIEVSPSLKYLYGSSGKELVVWNTVTAKMIARVSAHSDTLRDMVLDPVTGSLITVSFDKSLKIWTVKS